MLFALWVRLALAPVEAGLQYVTFFPSVTLAAVFAGYRAGLLASVIGVIFATYFFTPPYYSFSNEVFKLSLWSNIVFLVDGFIVSFSIEAMHRYRNRFKRELALLKESDEKVRGLNRELLRISLNVTSCFGLS
jgi:K+-sensing histidine kinase KdpD